MLSLPTVKTEYMNSILVMHAGLVSLSQESHANTFRTRDAKDPKASDRGVLNR